MSMNRYMHPRNIYKEPPNFKKLAIEYPEFQKYLTTDITGKVSFDFKNVEGLCCLTRTLLEKDFGLKVTIPLNKLIPTIPLRLNYILWIEDLLTLFADDHGSSTLEVKGIDIGTGASCVYPLLAAKKNKWHMLGTEIDPQSLEYAKKNVCDNSLEHLISIVEVRGDNMLLDILGNNNAPEPSFDFCMCNPPFFSSIQELQPFFKSRKQNRPHPKNAFCCSVNEVVINGGEVDYVSKIINESKTIEKRIKFYTSMVGHKSSLAPLKKLLREVQVASFVQTEFCQGNTTRWGLAWTYHDVDLRKVKDVYLSAKKEHIVKPLTYVVPKINDPNHYTVDAVTERLIKIFEELLIDFELVKRMKSFCEIVMTAYSNTWSHQRRRKRQQKLQMNQHDHANVSSDSTISTNSNQNDSSSSGNDIELHSEETKNGDHQLEDVHKTCSKLADLDVSTSPSVNLAQNKRALDQDDLDEGYYDYKEVKKLRTNVEQSSDIFLKAKICVLREKDDIGLQLVFIEGSGTKDSLNQVLQYIKNSMKESHL